MMKRIGNPAGTVLISLSLVIALAAGCKKTTTLPGGDDQGNPDANIQLSSNTIPDDFPSDIPVYKAIKSSKAITGAVKLLHMQSDDAKSRIADFYKKELTAAQWQVSEESRADRMEFMASKQQRSVTVSIVDKGEAGRVIDITY